MMHSTKDLSRHRNGKAEETAEGVEGWGRFSLLFFLKHLRPSHVYEKYQNLSFIPAQCGVFFHTNVH